LRHRYDFRVADADPRNLQIRTPLYAILACEFIGGTAPSMSVSVSVPIPALSGTIRPPFAKNKRQQWPFTALTVRPSVTKMVSH
jgi:hypothetical protein